MQNLGTIDNTYTILTLKKEENDFIIYSARHNQTQELHLIEVYQSPLPANLMDIMNNLIVLNHPYVIRVIRQGNGPIVLNNQPQVNRPYIVYENVTHSFLDRHLSNKRLTENQAKLIFKKILEGVRAMHNANLCHRNLNINNILLDDNYNPKITGFYYSCMNMNNLRGNVGREENKAPEVLKNQPYDGIKADIFSLGQILFNIVTAHFGFTSSASNNAFYKLIRLRNFELYWGFFAQFNLNLSQVFKDLFIIMVDPVPSERPTKF